MKQARDTWAKFPEEMTDYLRNNGWHFNKKACEYAVGLMRDRKGNKVKLMGKQEVEAILQQYGVTLTNTNNYDHVYAYHMGIADFYQSSIIDVAHLALYIKDIVDDPDAGEGQVMRRWYSDMVGKGELIFWGDML